MKTVREHVLPGRLVASLVRLAGVVLRPLVATVRDVLARRRTGVRPAPSTGRGESASPGVGFSDSAGSDSHPDRFRRPR